MTTDEHRINFVVPSGTEIPAQQPKERPRFEIRRAADALQPRPPVEYLVDKLIIPKSLSAFYGEGGAKKTYSLLAMAAQAASGGTWLDYKTKQTSVLFIDQEMGEDGLGRRIAEVLRGENLGPETPLSYVCYAGFKLDNKHDPAILRALIESEGTGLVIIDALAEIMDGDENSKADVQPVFNNLRWIADTTGAAIVIIHHANKAGGYRGSTVIKNSVDLLVQVESEDGENIINFTTQKNRYGGGKQKWAAVATWIKDPAGLADTFTLRPWSEVKTEHLSKSQDYVMRFLGDCTTPATIEDIENSADSCSPSAARQALYNLVSRKKVIRTNPGKNGGAGNKALYALVTEVKNEIPF